MSKTIIFCADGTWNNAGTEGENKIEAHTNVYKLFDMLQGAETYRGDISEITGRIKEIEKTYHSADGHAQIAKYINGVGNSKFKFNRALGGAFGFGLIERIARGYTFISRNYEPGAKIVIVGFSRGAYTARALAGLIARKGLLAKKFKRGDAESYDMAERAWYAYRDELSGNRSSFWDRVQNALTSLTNFRNFLLQYTLSDSDFTPNVEILAVGVWDTVGSLGIPDFEFGDKRAEIRDVFGFADLDLSQKVAYGFHAVALDEMRLMFRPTLWNQRVNVKQMLFSGVHADVGGGYLQAGLSNYALRWMTDELSSPNIKLLFSNQAQLIQGNSSAYAHKEWARLVKITDKIGQREFKLDVQSGKVSVHASVEKRVALPAFEQYENEAPALYRPSNY